jgi:hypothetical protein
LDFALSVAFLMRVRYLTFRFFCAEADAAVFLLDGVNRAFTCSDPYCAVLAESQGGHGGTRRAAGAFLRLRRAVAVPFGSPPAARNIAPCRRPGAAIGLGDEVCGFRLFPRRGGGA